MSSELASKRLSTAFDSVTLYGNDPGKRPDIYGKIGNAGVSICCLDDLKKLYSGFELANPMTSVSMTINGPAPIILAYFMNAAIDQQIEKHLLENSLLENAKKKLCKRYALRYPVNLTIRQLNSCRHFIYIWSILRVHHL